jgi:hypothetical protein
VSWALPPAQLCRYLLRFYEDGLVLHESLCIDVENKWDEIAKWFNRDAAATDAVFDIGVGTYTIKGSRVEFSTVAYDRECQLRIELEHSGAVEKDCLSVRTKLADDPRDTSACSFRCARLRTEGS